ncbi:MAG: site-specific DNA-methyltransferase, partial [Actinomycetota bacterium]|nr:site-specific DNA-methyltransferase [Actinomycetota bacterium]
MRVLRAGAPVVLGDDLLIAGDNLGAMAALPAGRFDMAYLDPPFNTGVERRRGALGYDDVYEDYLAFLGPRLQRVRELLAPHGTLYLHLDYREAHRCKLALDELFGEECFLN